MATRLRQEDCLGAGVTIPHKEVMLTLVDEVDPLAKSIGAINTVVNRQGKLFGYNTDSAGFLRALKERGGFNPKDKKVLLLGAGGAARAAAFTLGREQIQSLVVANRSPERAIDMKQDLKNMDIHITTSPMQPNSLHKHVQTANLIINSTSVGMAGGDAEGQSPLDGHSILSSTFVFDMVYNPPKTPLMYQASETNASVLGGLCMLIYQAAEQFPMWTGKQAPVDLMFNVGAEALATLAS